MKKTPIILLLFSLILFACNEADKGNVNNDESVYQALPASTEFDVVILNGRVMDPETNFDGIRNVGIKDGIIALITEEDISGKETIDATDKVVAPGFIDTHFHWQRVLGYKLGVRDGLTSNLDIELGCAGNKVAQWYADREGKSPANYGTGSSHELARAAVLDGTDPYGDVDAFRTRAAAQGWALTKPTLEQGNEILKIMDKGLQDGALGISSTLGYMRKGTSSREVFEAQKVAARYGRAYQAHNRYTPDDDIGEANGVQEIVANAMALNAPVAISHYNNPGWRLVHELISRLQDQGYNVWGEIYPYAAGSTTLNAVFLNPENWVDRLGHKYEETLQDVETGEFYTRETYEKALKETPTKEILLWKMPPETSVEWLKLKGTTMASDAMCPMNVYLGDWDTPWEEFGNQHPRGAGARAATLRMGREHDIPLMQLLSILSYNAAKHLGDTGLKAMQVRGRLQEGMVADIVVFDPMTVTDNSTYTNGSIPSTGFKSVLVNGVQVVKEDVVQKVFPGQPIRYEPEDKPRFEQVSVEAWEAIYNAEIEIPGSECIPVPWEQ